MTESEQTVSMCVSDWQETMAKALRVEAMEAENARLRQQVAVLLPVVKRVRVSLRHDPLARDARAAFDAYYRLELEGRDAQEA